MSKMGACVTAVVVGAAAVKMHDADWFDFSIHREKVSQDVGKTVREIPDVVKKVETIAEELENAKAAPAAPKE